MPVFYCVAHKMTENFDSYRIIAVAMTESTAQKAATLHKDFVVLTYQGAAYPVGEVVDLRGSEGYKLVQKDTRED
jgi:hypothetical protein